MTKFVAPWDIVGPRDRARPLRILIVPGPFFPLSPDEVAAAVSEGIRQVLTAEEAIIHQHPLTSDSGAFVKATIGRLGGELHYADVQLAPNQSPPSTPGDELEPANRSIRAV
jgi:hypothetical protein